MKNKNRLAKFLSEIPKDSPLSEFAGNVEWEEDGSLNLSGKAAEHCQRLAEELNISFEDAANYALATGLVLALLDSAKISAKFRRTIVQCVNVSSKVAFDTGKKSGGQIQ